MPVTSPVTVLGFVALCVALAAACGPRDSADATPTGAAQGAAAAVSPAAPVAARPIGFTGGASSPDALVAELLAALAAKDNERMHTLRVTRDEYNLIIAPGTVEAGRPPRELNDETLGFFWLLLDTRSRQFGDLLMKRYGGQRFAVDALRFSDPKRTYDWYSAQGEVRLDAKDEKGTPIEIRTGWIAEVDGRYKFISFQWDD